MPESSSVENHFTGYEIPQYEHVDPTHKPDIFWVRNDSGKVVSKNGRRKSDVICVNKIRETVDEWRADNYDGASQTTKDLFFRWFDEIRYTDLFGAYSPYWVQREAIETLVYLLEIAQIPDAWSLLEKFGNWHTDDLLKDSFSLQRTMDGIPQLSAPNSPAPIDLPPDELPRFAMKAATGSGKTMVMAHIIAWSLLHANREKGSTQAHNFLLLAPNVIVFERLRKDFEGGKIFSDLAMIPPGWKFPLQTILRGESAEPGGKNTLVVTNIQQLYENKPKWKAVNIVDALLGKPPVAGARNERPMLDRISGMKRLMVLNDEAHHLHNDHLEWNKTLIGLHNRNPLVAWLDFSATPKLQNGTIFPWVVTDYPLAQAVEQQIVKFPIVVKGLDLPDPTEVNKLNAVEKYGKWITAGVDRLRIHEKVFSDQPGNKPVMFVMCENVDHANALGDWLGDPKSGNGFKPEEILIIHTRGDSDGNIKEEDLIILRDQANQIDSTESPVRVVVSVLMLREGWDVRNVTIVLGLRPGNARAEILPEQAVGRGLRLMPKVQGTQVLEVLGTPAFQKLVAGIEDEGVIVGVVDASQSRGGHMIAPTLSRKEFDIKIPRTSATYELNHTNVENLDPKSIQATFSEAEFKDGSQAIRITFETMLHGEQIGDGEITARHKPLTQDSVAAITKSALRDANLVENFADFYPRVREYLTSSCFGHKVNFDSEELRDFLSDSQNRYKIVQVLAKELRDLQVEKRPVKIDGKPLKLSTVKPFLWNRDVLVCEKTIFNFVPTWNKFESDFARFLDASPDVKVFSALAENNTEFHVNYVKTNGALARYFPDWVVQQESNGETLFWIIETKGRVWPDTENKDAAVQYWCDSVSKTAKNSWKYMRVNQAWWNRYRFYSFDALKAQHQIDGMD